MTDSDGADEIIAGAARIAVTAAGLAAERAARALDTDARARQASAAQAVRELNRRGRATGAVERAVAEPGRRAAEQAQAEVLVIAADAADRSLGLVDVEPVEASRLAALHQARPAVDAVGVAPDPAEQGRRNRGRSELGQGQERGRAGR